MTIWMTADLHLGHAKAAEKRGFSSVGDHDERILSGLRKHVRPGDDLWVLGDVALGSWRTSILSLQTVPGSKICILGNHDRPHPVSRNGHLYLPEFLELSGFAVALLAATVRHGGKTYMLSHLPYSGDSGGADRHLEWRLPDLGHPLLHGHTHSPEVWSTSDERESDQLHVGVDAWGMDPVRLGEVVNYQ